MPNTWYTPSTAREAVDAIENVKHIICFLSDCITQEVPPHEFSLTDNGQTGLYLIYSFIEKTLDKCTDILIKEVN